MARLPQPGSDEGTWGDILNEYLSQSLKSDGSIKDNAVTNNAIAPDAITATEIADGSITEAQLTGAVQTKLNSNSGTPSWDEITDKPAVIAAGSTAEDVLIAVGAASSADLSAGLSSKVDKVSAPNQVYVTNNDGHQDTVLFSSTQHSPQSVVQRDEDGEIFTATATKSTSAVTKSQLDAAIAQVRQSPQGLYNLKPSNTRRLQRSLNAILAGTGRSSHSVIGDSLSSPYTGAGFDFPDSWWRTAKRHLVKAGYPDGGTGIVAICDAAEVDQFDPRISTTGSWTNSNTYLGSNEANATVTFIADINGNAVDIFYHNWSTGFGVSVDGGVTVDVVPTGADSPAVYSVTGLSSGLHTIVVTTYAAGCLLTGFRSRQSTGIEFHNIGLKYGYTASNWITDTDPGSIRQLTVGHIPDPDVLHLCIGANDIGLGNSASSTISAIKSVRELFPNSDAILYLAPQAFAVPWGDFTTAMYSLADEIDAPLVDLSVRFGDNATINAAGFISVDGLHPTVQLQHDVGALVSRVIQDVGPAPAP